MMKAKEILFVIAFSIILDSFCVDAGMAMGLGTWKNSVGKTKPWSRTKSQQKVWNRRPTAQRYNYLEEGNDQSNRIQTPDDGHKPCVGMCYYQKVLALENKLNDEKAENEIIEKLDQQYDDIGKPNKPCVGICQYYKSLGKANPYE